MQKSLRVLQCVGQLDRGGIETVLMELYRNIDRKKVQFDFVTHGDKIGEFEEEIKMLGANIYRVPMYTPRLHLQYKKAFSKLFVENPGRWKAVHGHMYTTSAIYLSIAKKHDLYAIAHSHTASHPPQIKSILKYIYYYRIRYVADYFFSCSVASGVYMFGHRVCLSDRFSLLKNVIDGKKFIFSEERRNLIRESLSLANRFVVGHIGRFDYPKNHNFIIEVFKEINIRKDDSILLLIGEGKLKKTIENKVEHLGLKNNVRFLGACKDISTLLQAMDILLFPSFFEGLPVVLIEAQASGLPILASDTVSLEAKLILELEFFSLNKNADKWAEKVLSMQKLYRRNTYNDIVGAGYDVSCNTKFLEEFYLNLST